MTSPDEKSRPGQGGSDILTSQFTGDGGASTVLDTALRYASNGIAVFPVRLYIRGESKKGVSPIGNWDGVSTTDPETIRSWFTGSWRDAALAIDCGKSGLVGVDQDVSDGKSGPQNWAELEHESGPRVLTPSGGYHEYYRADAAHPISVENRGAVADGVDIRGMGGFLFAPPTIDPRGGCWQWENGEPDWARLPIVPEVVVKRLAQAQADKRPKVSPASPGAEVSSSTSQLFASPSSLRDFGPDAGYKTAPAAGALLDRELTDFTALTEVGSGRSHILAQRLGVLAGHGIPEFWSYDFALSALTEACERNGFTAEHGEAYAAQQIGRGLDYGLSQPWHLAEDVAQADPAPAERRSRRVDLSAFLDGSYSPPVPSVGMARSDGKMLIYPERWHTVIGPNGTGKSFLALAHAIAEMEQGHTVAYAHFEESSPGGTLTRLRAMAPHLSVETISELFIWLDCASRWKDGEWAAEMKEINPSFVILDGINRACTQHGWDPSDINAPGSYGAQFVTPARVMGAAVLSLGHPPKAKGRETERHGFGSTAWLDDLEGVGFRLIPSKKRIKDGAHGYAMLYSVKDRYGEVEKGLEPADGKDMDGWYTVGSFWVDSTEPGRSKYGIKPEELNEDGEKKDKIDLLGEAIISAMMNAPAQDGQFKSIGHLEELLRTNKAKFTATDVAPAVNRLVKRGVLDSPEVPPRSARKGNFTLTYSAGSIEGLID